MKIKSLYHDVSAIERPVIVVHDLSESYDFRAIESGAIFTEYFPQALPEGSGGVILANVTASQFAAWVGRLSGFGRVQYWAPTDSLTRLIEVLEEHEMISVNGFSEEDSWIKIELAQAGEDRPVGDLVVGLKAGLKSGRDEEVLIIEDDPAASVQQFSDIRVRSILIARLAQRAKPIKRYLPAWAIHGAYKILGALR